MGVGAEEAGAARDSTSNRRRVETGSCRSRGSGHGLRIAEAAPWEAGDWDALWSVRRQKSSAVWEARAWYKRRENCLKSEGDKGILMEREMGRRAAARDERWDSSHGLGGGGSGAGSGEEAVAQAACSEVNQLAEPVAGQPKRRWSSSSTGASQQGQPGEEAK